MQNRRFGIFIAIFLAVAAGAAPQNSAAPHVLHARLKPSVWAAKYVTISGPDERISVHQLVPDTIVFDSAGRQVLDKNGYDGKGVGWIEVAIKNDAPPNAIRFTDFARDLSSANGSAFDASVPAAEPVVAVFGAVWCAPCRALKADLEKVPGITILDIDVNQANMNWAQVMEAVKSKASH